MKSRLILISASTLFFLSVSAKTVSVEDGRTIFSSHCAACHNVKVKVVGPALANVDQRHSLAWIVKFVHSSQSLVKANDKEAVGLFNEYSQMVMPDQPDLSDEQVKSIVEFIRSQSKTLAAADTAPFARPGKRAPDYSPVSINDYAFFGVFLAFIAVLIASLVLAVKTKEMQRQKNNPALQPDVDIY